MKTVTETLVICTELNPWRRFDWAGLCDEAPQLRLLSLAACARRRRRDSDGSEKIKSPDSLAARHHGRQNNQACHIPETLPHAVPQHTHSLTHTQTPRHPLWIDRYSLSYWLWAFSCPSCLDCGHIRWDSCCGKVAAAVTGVFLFQTDLNEKIKDECLSMS